MRLLFFYYRSLVNKSCVYYSTTLQHFTNSRIEADRTV